ncbi:MAG: hypothetical protein NZM04_08120 [Methylacidiphilales bacterium]|nr:hypothetical protein [Candidatus Methylacidiphilales bacterium]
MRKQPKKQLELTDAPVPHIENKFLEQIETLIDWTPIVTEL